MTGKRLLLHTFPGGSVPPSPYCWPVCSRTFSSAACGMAILHGTRLGSQRSTESAMPCLPYCSCSGQSSPYAQSARPDEFLPFIRQEELLEESPNQPLHL